MSDPVELTIATACGELAALQWGDADAPPLVALHGRLDNAASFAHLAPLLAETHRVIALDLPGHGRSAHLPERARRYHVVDQVDNVLDFADALDCERFDLLGHSLGAGIASLTAAAAPARIRRLMLIEGLGTLADNDAHVLPRWRDAHAQRGAARRKPRVFATVEDAVAARVAVGGLEPDEVRPIVVRNLREVAGGYAWRSDARLRLTTPLRIAESQARHILAGIATPTLLLLAKPATPYLPAGLLAERAACFGDIRVQHMAGPHHLHVRHPHEVANRILAFLNTVASSAAGYSGVQRP